MKFLRAIFFTIFLCLSMVSAASAVTQHDHVTYYIMSGESLTATWDEVEGTDITYDFQVLRFEWDNEVIQEWTEITVLEQEFTVPKAGMYIIRVRACNAAGDVSEWAESTNLEYAMVDNVARSWWIYGYTAPPGEIVIDGIANQGGGP